MKSAARQVFEIPYLCIASSRGRRFGSLQGEASQVQQLFANICVGCRGSAALHNGEEWLRVMPSLSVSKRFNDPIRVSYRRSG